MNDETTNSAMLDRERAMRTHREHEAILSGAYLNILRAGTNRYYQSEMPNLLCGRPVKLRAKKEPRCPSE